MSADHFCNILVDFMIKTFPWTTIG